MGDDEKEKGAGSVGDIAQLTKYRQYVRQRVTKVHNNVTSRLETISEDDRVMYIDRLESLKLEIKDLDKKLIDRYLEQGISDKDLDDRINDDEVYERRIVVSLSNLRKAGSPVLTGSNAYSAPRTEKLKLPEVPLPEFSNAKFQSLEKFFYNFESIVNKHNISSYEKFVYLRNQLSKSPRVLVDSLDIQEQSYENAKELLEKAFASTLTQKYEALHRLSSLKLLYNADPYTFIGDMRSIINSFKSLNIDVDTVLQYFIWNGLNDRFQNHLISITNNVKPSLDEMETHIFDATERYLRQNEKFKDFKSKDSKSFHKNVHEGNKQEKSSTMMATNVNYKRQCVLCNSDKSSDDNHMLRDCPVYIDPSQKVERLKSLKACTRCSYRNHETKDCHFKFSSKCKGCAGNHFTYLCVSESKRNETTKVGKENPSKQRGNPSKDNTHGNKSSSNGVALTEALRNSTDDNAICLPTFTCRLQSETVRVLRDSGCQRNFLCDSIAKKHNLKVLEHDIDLDIHGFNVTKTVQANLVEVPLLIADKLVAIKALTIPEIRTKLKLKGINSIVDAFKKKGYKLADEFILDNRTELIDRIGLVIGEDADYALPYDCKSFGRDPPSVFLETPVGVILTGSVERMVKNLDDLPPSCVADAWKDVEDDSTYPNNVISNKDTTEPFVPDCESVPNENPCKYENLYSHIVSRSSTLVDCTEEGSEEQPDNIHSFCAYTVVNKKGQIVQSELDKATHEILNEECLKLLNCDQNLKDEIESVTNRRMVEYVLGNTVQKPDGRLIMPLMWNNKIVHLLGKNFNLSKQILKSNLKRWNRVEGRMDMVNSVFKEQEQLGIIERIEDLKGFMEQHPECCFLPHMGIFKLERESTKCRVVFLSNLAESNAEMASVSNNQAMLPGPCLNHSIASSVMLLRFDTYMVLFDIKKAFLNIELKETDKNRLMFLWYKNVEKGDFSLIGYRNLRLSFGLRASPSILMLALYKILILDTENDDENLAELKKSIFNVIYMDNGGFSCNDQATLNWACEELPKIFEAYKFELQQYVTNVSELQNKFDSELEAETPMQVKLFGMLWDRKKDTISPLKISLDSKANTKRLIMSSIKSVYDIFNIYGPMMNRSNLFLQKLMKDKTLNWDTELPEVLQKEWLLITKQANATPTIPMKRFVGQRDSQYRLIAFTDSSKCIYGTVVYIQNLETQQVSFLTGKNRIVGAKLEGKTIPTLELLAICLGIETLQEIYQRLAGEATVIPIKIKQLDLYTDSMVSLHWLHSYACKYDKMQKRNVFVLNRLRTIDELCRSFPVRFHFINGNSNPADCLSRPVSYKKLVKTDYFHGPDFLKERDVEEECLTVTIPNPVAMKTDEVPELESEVFVASSHSTISDDIVVKQTETKHLIPLDRFSSFHRLASVYRCVLKFINNTKRKLAAKGKLTHLEIFDYTKDNLYAIACTGILLTEQKLQFPEIFEYFQRTKKSVHSLPNLVGQLNIFIGEDGLLRVKGKSGTAKESHPILLPKHSQLSKLIIRDLHIRFAHAGIFSLLKELRRRFWITHYYSTVRKVLRECITCRRLNKRPIKVNQSDYRDFRVDPPSIPFRYVFLDYMGPYFVIWNGEKKKVWVLIITCLWSRAINMKVCLSADVKDFLRAIQLHIFEYGMFELCMSDLGSQIVAGSHVITSFLDDHETQNYLQRNGIQKVKFDQFCKGKSSLGSLVESCVKLTKKLIYGAIRNNIIDYVDFSFIIAQTVHLVNKRPIAFKEDLRNPVDLESISAITPECLLKGGDLISINVIPEMQLSPHTDDPDWLDANNIPDVIRTRHEKMLKVRERLGDQYHSEFLATLVNQALDKRDRYKPVPHTMLKVGDIVLLKDKYMKPSTYPLGIVKKVDINALGEVTAASVLKGKTRELVYRHASSLIQLIPLEAVSGEEDDDTLNPEMKKLPDKVQRTKRLAAIDSQRKTKLLLQNQLG